MNSIKESCAQAVVSLGISVLDYSMNLACFPEPDSKQVALGQHVSGGGNAANAAVACSRLGVCARLLSKVADDAPGRTILAELESEGVDCRGVQISSGEGSTVTCFVMVVGCTRTILSMPVAQRVSDLEPGWVDRHFQVDACDSDLLAGAGVLQLDGRHPQAGARAARLARERGVPVLVEAELRSSPGLTEEETRLQLRSLLSQADYVVTSEDFPHHTFCNSDSTEDAVTEEVSPPADLELTVRSMMECSAPLARWVAVTLGAKGCLAVERCQGHSGAVDEHADRSVQWRTHKIPAFPIDNVVDTTGAGDAFIGGLAASLARGLPMLASLKVATWVGAMNCAGQPGARGGMPRAIEMPLEIKESWDAAAAGS